MLNWTKDRIEARKAQEIVELKRTDLPIIHLKSAPWVETDMTRMRFAMVDTEVLRDCLAQPGTPIYVTDKESWKIETFTSVDALLDKWVGD